MTPQRLLWTISLGILAVGVIACTTALPLHKDPADLERAPRQVGTPAPSYAGPKPFLPPSFDDARIFDPGWDVPPLESHGVYLAPLVKEDRVIFTAVSEEGVVLWTAERPMLCSAFVVTASEVGPLAVLMDITAGDFTMSKTTVSAYDLRTGAKRWGPVDVPGPHLGPGLTFAASPPATIGEIGPRLAIDPATGNTLADESREAGLIVLGESDGIVLLADDANLVARTAEEPALWSLPLADLDQSSDELRTRPSVQSERGLMLVGDRATGATLVNLIEGTITAHGVRGAELDRSTGTRSLLLDDELRTVDAAGQSLWSRTIPAHATLISAGNGAVYLRSAGGIEIFDTTSGGATLLLPGDAEAPKQITESGAGIVGPYQRSLLVIPAR
jgi:hypothetical protein